MRICILGGTGPSGILLIRECLSIPDCVVVVYARSPSKLPLDLTNNVSVLIIQGNLEDTETLSTAIEGADAVLSALGPSTKPTEALVYPGNTPLAHAYDKILDLMLKFGVHRLIALGTPSITDPNDKFDLKFSALVTGVATVARHAYKDIVGVGKTIRARDSIDWTIARVPLLNNGDSRDVVAGYVGDGVTKTTLSRAGFAAWVVEELQQSRWIRQAPLICTAC